MASSEDLRNLAEQARESGDRKPLLRYLKERRAMRQTPDDRVAVLTAEIERLRKQCVFLRDRSAEGQQLLHRALAHIDPTQSLYKEVRGHLYPQDQEEQR